MDHSKYLLWHNGIAWINTTSYVLNPYQIATSYCGEHARLYWIQQIYHKNIILKQYL